MGLKMTTIEQIKEQAEKLFDMVEAYNDAHEGDPLHADILECTIELENAVGDFLGFEDDDNAE